MLLLCDVRVPHSLPLRLPLIPSLDSCGWDQFYPHSSDNTRTHTHPKTQTHKYHNNQHCAPAWCWHKDSECCQNGPSVWTAQPHRVAENIHSLVCVCVSTCVCVCLYFLTCSPGSLGNLAWVCWSWGWRKLQFRKCLYFFFVQFLSLLTHFS